MFFVSVNQVLVRLWARQLSRGLTDIWVLRGLMFGRSFRVVRLLKAASTFRGAVVIGGLMRPVGPTCVVQDFEACCVWVCVYDGRS